MSATPKLLFVALGEEETPAFRRIATDLQSTGVDCTVVTWLPRLGGDGVASLADAVRGRPPRYDEAYEVLSRAGFPDPGMAADYDRDWYFASYPRKSEHVTRVYTALSEQIEAYSPTHLVSSVGGETTRVVGEAIARTSGMRRWYFNALPIRGRFVLLPALDAPFLPWDDDGRPMPLSESVSHIEQATPDVATPTPSLLREGMERFAELSARRELYPPTWLAKKTGTTVRQRLLAHVGAKAPARVTRPTKVLYPLHDERDFQVALRERHAIPQKSLLAYIASVLPPTMELMVKPHPQHRADHHPLLWRAVRSKPNVRFLDLQSSAGDAIAQCDVVLTLASSLGFEALQAGVPVVTYGSPFYSNRGLTHDVDDVRRIPDVLAEASNSEVSGDGVKQLEIDMRRRSWSGLFTPMSLAPSNLVALRAGLEDALAASGDEAVAQSVGRTSPG